MSQTNRYKMKKSLIWLEKQIKCIWYIGYYSEDNLQECQSCKTELNKKTRSGSLRKLWNRFDSCKIEYSHLYRSTKWYFISWVLNTKDHGVSFLWQNNTIIKYQIDIWSPRTSAVGCTYSPRTSAVGCTKWRRSGKWGLSSETKRHWLSVQLNFSKYFF